MSKLFKVIERYAEAKVARSWVGAKPVKEWDKIKAELVNAKTALLNALLELESPLKVGDKVRYLQDYDKPKRVYTVERVLTSGVYCIGCKTSFCDMVPRSMLRIIRRKK